MSDVLTEITPLSEKDCLYIVERHKFEFTYPLHQHREFELNFIENATGVKRIVGDSVEEIGNYDLVLICSENLEHVWEQGNCTSKNIREITIQFSPDLFSSQMLNRNQFSSISTMLQRADHGMSFPMSTILRIYHTLEELVAEKDRFNQLLTFLRLLYELSTAREQPKILSSSSFARASRSTESRRVRKVKQYINDHYTEALRLNELADLVGMTPSAFSRFFKLRTGKTLSDYIIDIRLGFASRELVMTTRNISEICFECGFNNLSNFNRIFKSKRGYSPRDFREMYRKKKVLV